jgi:hypothetical protein
LFYETDDLEKYFASLETAGQLPDLDTILDDATMLADHYTSQAAIQNSMRSAEATSAKNPNRVPVGSSWIPRGSSDSAADTNTTPRTSHTENPGFTGDRVLRNSEIFLLDFGWWIEMAWSVSEGDIGHVWEILKVELRTDFLKQILNLNLDLDIQVCWLLTPELHKVSARILLPLTLRGIRGFKRRNIR